MGCCWMDGLVAAVGPVGEFRRVGCCWRDGLVAAVGECRRVGGVSGGVAGSSQGNLGENIHWRKVAARSAGGAGHEACVCV